MASLSTYAKLSIYPNQFRPEENVTFKLQYSQDLIGTYATLYINNTRWDSQSPEATQLLDTAIGGQYLAVWEIPGGTLADSPTPDQPISMGSKITAYVKIAKDNTEVFSSNTIMVNMLMMWDGDFYFSEPSSITEVNSYTTNKSICTIGMAYIPRYDTGVSGSTDLQSYRVCLYNSEYELIFDSEEIYTWDTNVYGVADYTFYHLKDNTTYYIKSFVTLNGGYTMSRGYVPLYVKYADIPETSDLFVLENTPSGVRCHLDESIGYERFVVNRTIYNENNYLQIGVSYNSEIIDKYAIPKKQYIYRAVCYSKTGLIIGTYYNTITYDSSCVKISDVFGCYTALGDITKHPISRNDRGNILETMDSIFPRNIIVGSPNYDSGSVEGLFSDLDDDCTVITDTDYLAEKANILRAWLNNGRTKLLTYYTGEAWLVAVSGIQTTDPDNNDIYHTVFNWTQIGDAEKLDEYLRLGLVINDE